MRLLLAGLALFLAACTARPDDPAATVRKITVGGEQSCSAVAIAPGYALTARHCLSQSLEIDGKAVEYASAPLAPEKDIALLYAPGLQCPCATLGERPMAGDQFLVIGFPAVDNGKQRVTVGFVAAVKPLAEFAPWFAALEEAKGEFVFSTVAVLDPGHSGGGLFVRQNGQWRLVAINVIGVPSEADRSKEFSSGFTLVSLAAHFLP